MMLPSQQDDLPGREPLDEATLYRRREWTFAISAALYLIAVVLLPVWGASRVFALADLAPEIELGVDAMLPLCAFALPLGVIGAGLVCELHGQARARGLVVVGIVVTLVVLGLMIATAQIIEPAIAFASVSLVGSIATVEVYGAFGRATRGRHHWLRYTLAAIIGSAAGWGAFVLVAQQAALVDGDVVTLGATSATYVAAVAIVLWIPVAIVAKLLAAALRVAPFNPTHRLPEAMIVDDPETSGRRSARQTAVPRQRPYTTEEVAFFDAGENAAD